MICPSEIAVRRFLPALKQINEMNYIGVAVNDPVERYGHNFPTNEEIDKMLKCENEKANNIIVQFGGKKFESYKKIVTSDEIEAIYIPLPPALHFRWAKRALECGKHILLEKPFTISLEDTQKLIEIAGDKKLALHENYMFIFHEQINAIEEMINSGEVGDVRLYRISFGFPRRAATDFRYNKALGGGALIDAGGYTIKYATRLLGESAELKYSKLNYLDEFDVDIYGSATLVNDKGVTAQIAFGMDNDYKCELEVWGSKGTLRTGRVLTAPANFIPTITIKKNIEEQVRSLPADDAFKKSIEYFIKCTNDKELRKNNYNLIEKQAKLVDQFVEMAKRG